MSGTREWSLFWLPFSSSRAQIWDIFAIWNNWMKRRRISHLFYVNCCVSGHVASVLSSIIWQERAFWSRNLAYIRQNHVQRKNLVVKILYIFCACGAKTKAVSSSNQTLENCNSRLNKFKPIIVRHAAHTGACCVYSRVNRCFSCKHTWSPLQLCLGVSISRSPASCHSVTRLFNGFDCRQGSQRCKC